MAAPWLSVIIPTYNGERYLSAALESINSQINTDIECIIVDDGSTDSTVKIIEALDRNIPRTIKKIDHTGNWVANSNYALSLAKGKYICFLHQDDFWLPDRMKIVKEVLDGAPETELFLCPAIYANVKGQTIGQWRCPLPSRSMPLASGLLKSRLLIQNFIAISSPVFNRESALTVGGLDESLWYTADWDFWLKLSESANIFYCPRPLASFRIHPMSQTIRRSFDIRNFSEQLSKVFQKHYAGWQADEKSRSRTERNAMFSIQVNVQLAARIHGGKLNVFKMLFGFFRLGIPGWYEYLRDSRIVDRVLARLRSRVLPESPDIP
jgi:glycosyltransferase involved in cell wall biosynthesis